jgi:serine/threonine-protein kinase
MSLSGILIVPDDVEIYSVARLPSELIAKLSAQPSDFAVTRRGFRGPSVIVDEGTASLLELFRTPSVLISNVIKFSASRDLNPACTLDEAYPSLVRLAAAKFLVPAGTSDAEAVTSKVLAGTEFFGFRVVRPWQTLDDSEVVLARSQSGLFAAVKVVTDDARVRALKHEADLMQLAAGRAPVLYGFQQSQSGAVLVSEWINGRDVFLEASQRRREHASNSSLLKLCLETVRAFADLHAAGLLHGDVHPANVIVEPEGKIRLIDYGLACTQQSDSVRPPRGGIAFYLEPELAAAQLLNESVPLTTLGEQYSVGALLYQMWTGCHYVDWRLERQEMLTQVRESAPEPFAKRGAQEWPKLEQILARAMSKNPSHRFSNMSALASALEDLLVEAQRRDQGCCPPCRNAREHQNLLARTAARYEIGGLALRNGITRWPLVSITYGASGVAYAMCRLAKRQMRADLLAAADIWVEKGYATSAEPHAFLDDEMGINSQSVGAVSLFHSITGLDMVRALVSVALGDLETAQHAIQQFTRHCMEPCEHHDMTLGRAGILLGAAEILEACTGLQSLDLAPLYGVAEQVSADLIELLRQEQVATSRTIPALGLAHGWAGLLFALLRWSYTARSIPNEIVTQRLTELWELREPHSGGSRWPVYNRTHGSAFMDGWCNGTAGQLMLNALAADVLGLEAAAGMVELCARSVSSSRMHVSSLCCGLAGMSYSLIAAYRVTGSKIWLDRAIEQAEGAIRDQPDDLRDSLYKGDLGVAVLFSDLGDPMNASMPLVQPSFRI